MKAGGCPGRGSGTARLPRRGHPGPGPGFLAPGQLAPRGLRAFGFSGPPAAAGHGCAPAVIHLSACCGGEGTASAGHRHQVHLRAASPGSALTGQRSHAGIAAVPAPVRQPPVPQGGEACSGILGRHTFPVWRSRNDPLDLDGVDPHFRGQHQLGELQPMLPDRSSDGRARLRGSPVAGSPGIAWRQAAKPPSRQATACRPPTLPGRQADTTALRPRLTGHGPRRAGAIHGDGAIPASAGARVRRPARRRPGSAPDPIRTRQGRTGPQPASAFFTSAETWPMSALPASCGLSAPISLPMSAGPAAPVWAMAAAMAAWISASPSLAGR